MSDIEIGWIIVWPSDDKQCDYIYLFKDNEQDVWTFETLEDAKQKLKDSPALESGSAIYLYHTSCAMCGKEYFIPEQEFSKELVDPCVHYYNINLCSCNSDK